MGSVENKLISDEILVNNFRAGDKEAFCELISRYSEKAHNLCMRISRNEEDTEGILQDVFITVYKKIDKFEGKSAFSSWLYRITVNTAFMKLRKRKQKAAVSFEDLADNAQESWTESQTDTPSLNYLCSRHELRSRLETAIAELPNEYKAIFMLRDVDGLSNQEVSEILKISVPAVKSRLHRARLLLRKSLEDFYSDYTSEENIHYGANYSQEMLMAA